MILYSIGDGYTSGCCTANQYVYASDDKKYFGMHHVEHPENRPGSFINPIGEIYKAPVMIVGCHRKTLEEMTGELESYKEQIKEIKQEVIAFIGIPDLRSVFSIEHKQLENLFGKGSEGMYNGFLGKWLMLDGMDIIDDNDTDTYFEMCQARDKVYEPHKKVYQLEQFIKEISTITKQVIVYRTTHKESLDLNLPENVSFLNESIVDILAQKHKPYRKGYYDAEAYKTLKHNFLKLLR